MTTPPDRDAARHGTLAAARGTGGRLLVSVPFWVAALLVLAGSIAVLAVATPPAEPSPAPVSIPGPYGSVQGDSRNNHEIGRNNRLAYRFRASTTSAVTSIRVQQRGLGGGDTYSGGTGGTIRVSLQTDDHGAPSGTVLSMLTFSPGNPTGNWENWNLLTFPAPASLTAGEIYHVVFDNVDSAPDVNWISLNALFYWGRLDPRQPMFNDDFAVLYASPARWVVQPTETPIMDLAYADGVHDGMGYIGAMGEHAGTISGSVDMVREHFTVSGAGRLVSAANVKVKRIEGTGALTIQLEDGDGTPIEAVNLPASSIALGNLPLGEGEAELGGNSWASAGFGSPHLLVSGHTYNLRLSTTSGTQYIAVPVQEGTDKGLESYRFTDGDGQGTSDGGSSWANLYQYGYVDLQFYFQ